MLNEVVRTNNLNPPRREENEKIWAYTCIEAFEEAEIC